MSENKPVFKGAPVAWQGLHRSFRQASHHKARSLSTESTRGENPQEEETIVGAGDKSQF